MRISDWSSDVCSSDLAGLRLAVTAGRPPNRLSAVHSLRILCTDRLRAYEICRRHGAVQIGSGEGQVLPQIPAGHPLAFPRPILRPGSLDGGADRRAARAAVPPGRVADRVAQAVRRRSEEHTSELQSLMRISYAVF